MTNGAGWPIGPCALVDLVGIDVHVHASEALYASSREAAHGAAGSGSSNCSARTSSVASGAGFYSY